MSLHNIKGRMGAGPETPRPEIINPSLADRSLAKPGRVGNIRVTLELIARQLDVSTATVSLALRNSPLVAETTRHKVQNTARELGYSYNRSAASLRTARTNIIGVGFHDITNPYFAELLSAIEEASSSMGRSILLGTYGEKLERQTRVLDTFREYRPDGIILCPAGGSSLEVYNTVLAAGIPLVQVSREIEGAGLDFVGSDNALGTEIALKHLHALGHRRIALIGGTDSISTGKARRSSYRTVMNKLGLAVDEALMIEGFGTRDTGFLGMQTLLKLKYPPTAAACFNDLSAFGAMLALRHNGREAGRDFAIIGCDDVSEAAQWFPALTTLQNRQADMGAKATSLVFERIAAPERPAQRIIIAPTLVVRASTMPLAI